MPKYKVVHYSDAVVKYVGYIEANDAQEALKELESDSCQIEWIKDEDGDDKVYVGRHIDFNAYGVFDEETNELLAGEKIDIG